MDIVHPLNCLMCKSQTFVWTPECQASFDMLHSWLTNTPIAQLPNIIKLYLLFTDVSKICYSGVLTQASTEDSNEVLLRIFTSKSPLKGVKSQTHNLWLESNIIYPVAYISGSFSQNQCRWSLITEECFSVFMLIKNIHFTYKMTTC